MSKSNKQRFCRKISKRNLRIGKLEPLESRDLLAGDVSVYLLRGDLSIRGDSADNQIAVSRENDAYVIRGLEGTTVGGEAEVSIPMEHVHDDMRISLGRGDDTIEFNDISVADDLFVNLSFGHDTFEADGLTADSIMIEGSGADRVLLQDATARQASILVSGEASEIGVVDSEFTRHLAISARSEVVAAITTVEVGGDFRFTASRESTLLIRDSEIGDDTRIRGGRNTRVLIEDSAHHDDVLISTSQYEDFLAVDGVTIGGVTHVSLGSGDDAIVATDTSFVGRTTLSGGAGHDALETSELEFGSGARIGRFEAESVENADSQVAAILKTLDDADLLVESRPSLLDVVFSDFPFLGVALFAPGLAPEFVESLGTLDSFTVFAPTDAAFEALGTEVFDSLVENDTDTLGEILSYHILPEELSSSDLLEKSFVTTIQGQVITLDVKEDGLFLNGNVKVELTDVKVQGGIVHVIDTVLMPPVRTPSIAEVVADNDSLSRLNGLLEATGLNETLQGGEFTLFAPQNSGLALLTPQLTQLLLRFAPQFVTDLLLNHVVEGRFDAATLLGGESVTTLSGRELQLESTDDGVTIRGAAFGSQVVEADIEAGNGVVHIIDTVLV